MYKRHEGMKGSRRAAEGPGKAIGEGTASAAMETPAYWRCQAHGTTTKGSGKHGVEPAWPSKTSCVCYGWQSQRSRAAHALWSPED